jgi:pyruvate-formate lyase-activating enzyme
VGRDSHAGSIVLRMQPLQVLLVNPPIFDFTAFDFWLRPYGMMRVAGKMRHACRFTYFDFLTVAKRDPWGRGRFEYRDAPRPSVLSDIPRRFHRFGRPREEFRELLRAQSFDAVLIQTSMTYWYQGIQEAIRDVRELQPSARIVIGGIYASLCSSHARSLDPDLVIEGSDLEPLWALLSIQPETGNPYQPLEHADVGILKLSEGCPFHCTYCAAPLLWPGFAGRPTVDCLSELNDLVSAGVKNIAFYDDALLYQADEVLMPFLDAIIKQREQVLFHTPNALNARFMTAALAQRMVQAGFAGFFFGLESGDPSWQKSTGGKVDSEEFATAVNYLREAGAPTIYAYVIIGHPDSEDQDLEQSLHFAHRCGVRVMLSEFSPIPGTLDGQKSTHWADLDEPLSHNKTAFAIRRLGMDYVNHLKQLSHSLNGQLD